VFGLVRGASHGWTSGPVLGALAGGVVLLAAFGAWESVAATAMLPLSLFRSRGFSAASATMMLTTMGMFGVIFLVSQFLQSVLGYTPLAAGVHGLPWTAAPAVTAPVAGLLADRLGGRRIVAIGVALQATGIGWLATVITPGVSYGALVPSFLIAGAGLGFFFAPITQLTLRYAPGPLEGIASGTSNALRQAGTVLGVAVLGSVFSAAGGRGGMRPAAPVPALTSAPRSASGSAGRSGGRGGDIASFGGDLILILNVLTWGETAPGG
jgi:nitrate/nitrite transporter NarK